MRRAPRTLLPILIPLLLAGCQGGESAKNDAPTLPLKPAAPTIAPPYSTDPTELALVHENREVKVGMGSEDAFKAFAGLHDRGLEGEQLPPGFASPYHAQWYELAQEGFGVITYQGKVAAAMYQMDHSTVDAATEMVKLYVARFGNESSRKEANGATYWFWERDHQRLMICAYPTQSEGVSIAVCVGDATTLDALNASPERTTGRPTSISPPASSAPPSSTP